MRVPCGAFFPVIYNFFSQNILGLNCPFSLTQGRLGMGWWETLATTVCNVCSSRINECFLWLSEQFSLLLLLNSYLQQSSIREPNILCSAKFAWLPMQDAHRYRSQLAPSFTAKRSRVSPSVTLYSKEFLLSQSNSTGTVGKLIIDLLVTAHVSWNDEVEAHFKLSCSGSNFQR